MRRFARISVDGRAQWAAEVDGALHSLQGLVDGDGFAAIAGALSKLDAAGIAKQPKLDAGKAKWLQPVPTPGKIVCLGLNYAAHAAEGGHKTPEYPAFFMRATTSMLAHNEPMVRPTVSDKFDYEAELAVVIGKRARHLTDANALDCVLGYSCFNDGSLRDYQRKASQWTIGKNFDATGPIGPWLVPASELPPGCTGLKIESRLNGQVMQSDNTSNMIVSVQHALVLLSEAMTLEPGDVIAMGTPSGVGYARNPPVFMKPGDTIEIEIEKVGLLSNKIVGETK
jgi:2-keto-4-pentenoate hydratase/2-oxohepta-3-ene-1,7-dioic acid hydratase in catechol pathway